MPPSTDEKILRLITAALQRGESRNQISTAYQVSPRNITRISANLKKYGSPKAPPSGLKQGRPIKMTKEQAEAMLAWMAGKHYTFYVKDLTVFLQKHCDFKGCDGTVRRAIIRAGFKRELPWHKSQITSWIQPDGPPDLSFVYNANPPPSSARSRAAKRALSDSGEQAKDLEPSTDSMEMDSLGDSLNSEDDVVDMEDKSRQLQQNSGIDPALRDLGLDLSGADFQETEIHHTPSRSRADQRPTQIHPHVAQMSTSATTLAPSMMPLDPQLSESHLADSRLPSQPSPDTPLQLQSSNQGRRMAREHRLVDAETGDSQEQQLVLMQNQLNQQAELIARLQQQLASQQSPRAVTSNPVDLAARDVQAGAHGKRPSKSEIEQTGSIEAGGHDGFQASILDSHSEGRIPHELPTKLRHDDSQDSSRLQMLHSFSSGEPTHHPNAEYDEDDDDAV